MSGVNIIIIKKNITCCAIRWLDGGGRCIRPTPEELEDFGTPDFTIYNAGQFPCNRYTHYMTSSTSIDLNLSRREMVILGTQYAGEMKKGLFSVMHYLMPKRQILSLHSGCNMGKDGDVALFFGLSGKVMLECGDHRHLPICIHHNHPASGIGVSCWYAFSYEFFCLVQVLVKQLCPPITIGYSLVTMSTVGVTMESQISRVVVMQNALICQGGRNLISGML